MKDLLKVISEGFKIINQWQKTAYHRKAEACKEAAEKYIQTNEDKDLSEKQKKKLLRHYRKRFFKYN